jgi:antitoxin (DNA-binding transcriptional repressor) of toxin-antitoxin stability system
MIQSTCARARHLGNVATSGYIDGMRAIGIKALRDRLSEYLRVVATGETVLVTDRDRVVAELVPPRPGRLEAVDDACLAELVRTGLLVPASVRDGSPPPRVPVLPTDRVLEDLARDRAER